MIFVAWDWIFRQLSMGQMFAFWGVMLGVLLVIAIAKILCHLVDEVFDRLDA